MIRLPPINDRLRLVLVLFSAAALIAASLIVAAYNERRYQVQVLEATKVQAQVLAETVSAALSFGDRTALQEYVDALKANSGVDAAGVYDERGRLVASYARTALSPHISQVLSPAEAPGRVIVFAPVTQDGVALGTVYVRDRTEPLLSRLSHYVGPGLLVVMAVLMFVIMSLDARVLRRVNLRLVTQIAEREKAEAALRQAQKMEAIGQLTGGIAHDFNNMLAIILGSLDILLRRHTDADPRILRLAGAAMEGANRAAALTQRLLAFSRMQPLKPSPTDVAKVVTDMADLLRRTLGETVAVETVSAGGLWRAHIDQSQLETAVVNLAINARDAMDGGGKLTVETGNAYLDRTYAEAEEDLTPGQYVMVAITDTGSGMSSEVLDRAFEPFFTTKPPGLGTGLGLSQVQGFIKQSGGHIRIYSEIAVGTTVKLYLPRSFAEPERARAPAARSRASARRNVTVLVVEDEAGVRDFAIEALGELGYDVVSADGPEGALEELEAHPEVQLLLTDVVMSVMNGRALSEAALRRRPNLAVVFMTGYSQNAIVHNGVLDPGTHLVSKPFTIAQLGAEIEAALAGGQTSA
jgi:signal transduction histidine kinase/ActR/RegA family two-component response regulator